MRQYQQEGRCNSPCNQTIEKITIESNTFSPDQHLPTSSCKQKCSQSINVGVYAKFLQQDKESPVQPAKDSTCKPRQQPQLADEDLRAVKCKPQTGPGGVEAG